MHVWISEHAISVDKKKTAKDYDNLFNFINKQPQED
jgi:hypothetical protein